MVEPTAAPVDSLLLPLLILFSLLNQARQRARVRRQRLAPIVLALVTGSLLALGGQSSVAPAQAASTQVRITDTGFVPASIMISPGDSVHWTNEASGPHTVTASNGAFDSGSLAAGAGFSITVSKAGTYAYASAGNGAFTGTLRVQDLGLPGPATDLAINHLPNVGSQDSNVADISLHPTLAIPVSRTRILTELSPMATVGQ
jgi:plastocyanin